MAKGRPAISPLLKVKGDPFNIALKLFPVETPAELYSANAVAPLTDNMKLPVSVSAAPVTKAGPEPTTVLAPEGFTLITCPPLDLVNENSSSAALKAKSPPDISQSLKVV